MTDLDAPLALDDPAAPHSASGESVPTHDLSDVAPPARPTRRWFPKRVVATPPAYDHPHGRHIMDRIEAYGIEVERLKSARLTGVRGENDRQTYARAKSTLAIVVSPPSRRKLQPIAPSADWRFDLAEGCPAHCQYCYLAGSLSGPPVTRVYADLDNILDGLSEYVGQGTVTSRRAARRDEGTTFETSCYTDPLALDHLTGSWQRAVQHFGAWNAPVQLRWTTKFGDVDSFVGLSHNERIRVRFSVNCLPVTTRMEGGTSPLADRVAALRKLALDGYPVGLTIAPIMTVEDWRDRYGELLDAVAAAIDGVPDLDLTAETIAPIMTVEDWRDRYGELLDAVAAAIDGVPDLDLTAELITHRFTPGSKEVLLGWYPRTRLEMDEDARTRKHGKFGAVKYVYPADVMTELRGWFESEIASRLPACRILYWT